MSRFIIYLAISCVLIISAFAVPIDDSSQDSYIERVKLLTGGKTEPSCDQNKDDLSDCLKQIFTDIMPRVAVGIPELNILPFEPLILNRTTFQFNFGTTNGRLTMKNASLTGFTSSIWKEVDFKVNDGNTKLTTHSFVPLLRILGNYKADVTINNRLHFKPRGTFNLTLYDVDIFMTTQGKLYEKDGHQFVRLHDIDATPKIGNLDVDVTGIFDDPELSDLVSNFAKQYWRDIYSIMLPETRGYWAPLVLRLLNESLSLIPYDLFVKSK